ncbi:hypothetical protein KBD61_01870 [Patescibacteria group bacterium]|nr:hypothetical protein [Patescibacteria group bacterium]
MSDRLKRVLFIVGFIALCIGLGVAIYYVFFRPSASPDGTDPQQIGTGQLPQAGDSTSTPIGQIPDGTQTFPTNPDIRTPLTLPEPPEEFIPSRTQVISESVTKNLSPTVDGTQGVRFYNPTDGRFYRITEDGLQIPLSDQIFPDVEEVSWGKSSDKAVLTFPDGSHIYYDFATGKQATLPRYWDEFDFSPNDNQLVSKSVGNNEDNRYLITANPDGSGARAVEELGQNQDKVHVSWSPNDQIIAYGFTAEPIGFDRQAVVMVGKNKENFKNLVVEGRGFTPKWSPSGQNVLYSVYSGSDGFRPSLWVSGASGDAINTNRRNLNLQTWVDKCTWQSEQVVYCAVPSSLEAGAALQPGLFRNTQDFIYKIDLSSGSLTNLGQPEGSPSVDQITIGSNGQALFFNDASSGKLIRFSLE